MTKAMIESKEWVMPCSEYELLQWAEWIAATAKPKRQSDASSSYFRKKSERPTVESRHQVSTMNHKSKRLEEAKLGNTATAAKLAITDAHAKGAKAKSSDESQEHKT